MTSKNSIYRKETKSGPRYQVRWWRADGTQGSKTFRTSSEAKNFKRQVEVDKLRGLSLNDRRARLTFKEVAEEYFTSQRHSPSTVRRREGILRNHIYPTLGNVAIGRIRHSDISRLVSLWISDGLSARTIRNHIRTISPIFGFAANEEMIVKSPTVGIKLPRPNETRRNPLSPEQCRELLDNVKPFFRPMVQFALATGLRWSELCHLDIGDLDLDFREVRIQHSKTEAGRRTIPISDSEVMLVLEHLSASKRLEPKPDSPLFVSEKGTRINYSNFRQRIFRPALRAAGLERVTFHDLRRTHATMLVAEGHDAKVVQRRMGHASISTTLGFYAEATEAGKKRAAGALARYLEQEPADPAGRF